VDCRIALLLCLTACGRFGFDERQRATDAPVTGDAAGDASGDAAIDAGPDGAPAMVAQVQVGTVAQSAGGPITTTLPAPSTAGTLLAVAVATNDPTSLALPAGWQTAVLQTSSGTCSAAIGYLPNNPGGVQDIVVTINAGVPIDAIASEWSGATAVDVIGQSSSNNPQTAQAVQTAMPTTVARAAAIAVFCEDANNPTYVVPNGWSVQGQFSNVSSSPSFVAEAITGLPAGVVMAAATSSIGGKYQAAIATFR